MRKNCMTILVALCAVLWTAMPAFAAQAPEEKAAADGSPPEFEYIELKPLILPVITDKGLMQQVSIVVSLELPYGKMEAVQPYTPRLADAYLRDLYATLGAGGAMGQGDVIDPEAIKHRLDVVTARILGDEQVHDILLQVIRQKPL